MKDYQNINQFLLPSRYRKYGVLLIFAGIPVLLLTLTLFVFNYRSPDFPQYWESWGGYLLHIPISLGLFWMLFASEKEEDEMFLSLRLKAMFHGIKFVFVAILMLPGFYLAGYYLKITDKLYIPDIGGNLAVVSLLLLYAYGTYHWLKKKQLADTRDDEE